MRTPVRFARLAVTVVAGFAVAACGPAPPPIECGDLDGCEEVAEAGRALVPPGTTRIVVLPGRAPAGIIHLELHACAPDDGYALVDVFRTIDGVERASLREVAVDDPPCR